MSQATGAELVSAFEPHPTVRHHLLFLLHQYAQHSLSSIVRDAFASFPMNAMNVQVTLHEYVDIAAQGYFQGYRDSFSIAATNRYGQGNRQRYDTVEVTIPSEAGGAIASTRDLVRPRSDERRVGKE